MAHLPRGSDNNSQEWHICPEVYHKYVGIHTIKTLTRSRCDNVTVKNGTSAQRYTTGIKTLKRKRCANLNSWTFKHFCLREQNQVHCIGKLVSVPVKCMSLFKEEVCFAMTAHAVCNQSQFPWRGVEMCQKCTWESLDLKYWEHKAVQKGMQVQMEDLALPPGQWSPPKSQQCSAPLLMKSVLHHPREQRVCPQPLHWLPHLLDQTPVKPEQY